MAVVFIVTRYTSEIKSQLLLLNIILALLEVNTENSNFDDNSMGRRSLIVTEILIV